MFDDQSYQGLTGDIANAIMQEVKSLMADTGGTFILKTDYKSSNLPGYTMPLVIVDMVEAEDTYQFIGGVSRNDWMIVLSAYNLMPDMTTDDNSGYSRNTANILDYVRRHFSIGKWLNSTVSPTLDDVLNNYNFKFVLGGMQPADALEEDGVAKGHKIVFNCVALDFETDSIQESAEVLEIVNQVDNPPFD